MIRKRSRHLYSLLLAFFSGLLIWFFLTSPWTKGRLKGQLEGLEESKSKETAGKLDVHNWTQRQSSYFNVQDLHAAFASSVKRKEADDVLSSVKDYSKCQMESCFNFKRCTTNSFKVYVYPIDPLVPISSTYDKILSLIMASPYYTNDPAEACIFVLSIDTLDRDELSREFVRNVPARLKKLQASSFYFTYITWQRLHSVLELLKLMQHYLNYLGSLLSYGTTERIISFSTYTLGLGQVTMRVILVFRSGKGSWPRPQCPWTTSVPTLIFPSHFSMGRMLRRGTTRDLTSQMSSQPIRSISLVLRVSVSVRFQLEHCSPWAQMGSP
jgi:hypothetical protein